MVLEKVVSSRGLEAIDLRLVVGSSIINCSCSRSLESRRDLRLRRELSGLRRRRGSLIIVTAGANLPWVASTMYSSCRLFCPRVSLLYDS